MREDDGETDGGMWGAEGIGEMNEIREMNG
jgi:hypothetical protein